MPTVPPTWRTVWIAPEAWPLRLIGAELIASVFVGLITIPTPAPIST